MTDRNMQLEFSLKVVHWRDEEIIFLKMYGKLLLLKWFQSHDFYYILWLFVTHPHFCSVRLTTIMVGQTCLLASIYMELSFVCKALSFVYPTFSFVYPSQRGQKLLGLRPRSLLTSFQHIWRLLSPRQTQISPDNVKGKAEYCYQCNKKYCRILLSGMEH